MTKLCPRGKAAAKRKFAVYPSAYANAYASKICAGKIKDPSGVKRKDFKGPKRAASGALINAKRMIEEKSPKPGAAFELRKRLTGKKIGGISKTAGAQSALGRLEKSGMNKGGLKAELNNPAKGYTAGGMADYYKDLM